MEELLVSLKISVPMLFTLQSLKVQHYGHAFLKFYPYCLDPDSSNLSGHNSSQEKRTRGCKMQDGLIRVTELATMLSVSRSTIWRWVKDNSTFPNPIKVSDKVTAWRRDEIQDWLQSREGITKKAFIE